MSGPDVRHVARLARIHLTDEEVPQYQKFVDDYEDQVLKPWREVPMPDAAQVTDGLFGTLVNVMREDEVRPSLPVEVALGQAPDREGDLFRVQASLPEPPAEWHTIPPLARQVKEPEPLPWAAAPKPNLKLGQRDGQWVVLDGDEVVSRHANKSDAVTAFTERRAKPAKSTECRHGNIATTHRGRFCRLCGAQID